MIRLIHSKWLYLAVVLVLSFSLTSCGILSGVQKAISQRVGGEQTATAAPASPTPDKTTAQSTAPLSTGPILERALESEPVSLIDDRLFVQMPAGAEDDARQQGLMGAKYSSHEETRLVLEGGGQQLIVYAQETFYYTDNEQDDIGKILKWRNGEAYTYKTERLRDSGDGFRLIKVTPDTIDTSANAVIIREAIAITNDNTMIYIGVFVTPETAADTTLCVKQADRILDSIRPGARTINTSAHEETIAEQVGIRLDKGYVLVQQDGADFIVYYITKVTKLGESIPSVGIYIGGHPTLVYPGRGIDKSQLNTVKDTILKTQVDWWTYKRNPDKENYSAETVFELPRSEYRMHVFVEAANEAEFMKIRDMIHTMKFK